MIHLTEKKNYVIIFVCCIINYYWVFVHGQKKKKVMNSWGHAPCVCLFVRVFLFLFVLFLFFLRNDLVPQLVKLIAHAQYWLNSGNRKRAWPVNTKPATGNSGLICGSFYSSVVTLVSIYVQV